MSQEPKKNRFIYRDLFGDMPPKKHDIDPYKSEIIRFIDDIYEKIGAPRSIEDCVKAFETARKADPPIIVFNRTQNVWIGWNNPLALKAEISALKKSLKSQEIRLRKLEKELFGEGYTTTPMNHPQKKRFSRRAV